MPLPASRPDIAELAGKLMYNGKYINDFWFCVVSYPSILRLAGNTAGAAQKGEY